MGPGGPVGRGGKLGGGVESSLALELVLVSSSPAYRSSPLSPSAYIEDGGGDESVWMTNIDVNVFYEGLDGD